MNHIPIETLHEPHKKPWPAIKVVSLLAFTIFIFILGVGVGRGNISINALSVSIGTKSSTQLDYSSVDKLYTLLQKDFDGSLDKQKVLDGIKSGLVSSAGDPYTVYFNAKDAKAFNDQLSGSITGIGAELGTDSSSIVIVSPLSGYPAEKAGLKPKDVVAAIDGQSTAGMSVDSAVSKIRGTPGTQVKLSIIRDGASPFAVTITREKITIPSVDSKIDGNIGYLKISQFGPDTVELAQKVAKNFKDSGVKGIVLDLRGNPGGYLSGAVDVSSLWLDNGKTVVIEKRGGEVVDTQYSTGSPVLKGLPTVILINGGSASASEITAGALSDNNVATLIGQKSFGKGSVQRVESLSDGSELKVTIAHWYTPNGKNIDKQGISPEVEVGLSDSDIKAGVDSQKDKAYEIVRSKIAN